MLVTNDIMANMKNMVIIATQGKLFFFSCIVV